MNITFILHPILALILSPLLMGIINRIKALFAGRRGQPLFQLYYDLWKLLQKGAVYSRTTSWIFRAGPIVSMASVLVGTVLVPLGGLRGISFEGDFILLIYLLALMRFFVVIAALDTGSSFEGMGASREVQFSALAEPALFVALATLARKTGHFTMNGIFSGVHMGDWVGGGSALLIVALALFMIFLAENARIPVDDPNTHLELTMIHEVMVLDHSGPDFALILYGAAMKLWLLGMVVVNVLVPSTGILWLDILSGLLGMGFLAVLTGIVESSMARLRLVRVPQLLVGSGVLSVLSFILVLKG